MNKCEDNPKPWSTAICRRILTSKTMAIVSSLCIVTIVLMRAIRRKNVYSYTIPCITKLCPNRIRAGDEGDGGWWICSESTTSPKERQCVVYSFGIRDNFSFDHYMVNRGCQVHGFDPSPAGLASRKEYEKKKNGGSATYHSYGLGYEDKTYGAGEVPFRWPGLGYLAETNTLPWELYRLPTIMSKLDNKALTVLKVDVEGAEWDVIQDIVEADWDELYMELHFPPGEYTLTKTNVGELQITRGYNGPPSIHLQSKHPARNVSGPIDRIELVRLLNQVADMYYWEPNGLECAEIYFRRKDGKKRINFGNGIPRAPLPKDEVE